MNSWNVTGRFIKDPETTTTQGGTSVCRFCLSVADSQYDKDKKLVSSLFNFTAFGKMGEAVAKYFKKGSTIELTARVAHNTYKNKQGIEVTATEYYVEKMSFPPKSTASSDNGENTPEKTQTKTKNYNQSDNSSIEDDEDFPF